MRLGNKEKPKFPEAESHDADLAPFDVYFSADVETDGPIPGPFSMLSFALVYAGRFDGVHFTRPDAFDRTFYRELKPISTSFEPEALQVNGLDRDRLCREGEDPEEAMTAASRWIKEAAGHECPVLVAYPLSFDWAWLYWYFRRFSKEGSPFSHSRCFDLKTAFAVKAALPIAQAAKSTPFPELRPSEKQTNNALDHASEHAEIFEKISHWEAVRGRKPHAK